MLILRPFSAVDAVICQRETQRGQFQTRNIAGNYLLIAQLYKKFILH